MNSIAKTNSQRNGINRSYTKFTRRLQGVFAHMFAVAARASAGLLAIATAAVLFPLTASSVQAAPGDLDLSFAPGLIVTPIVEGGSARAQAVAMDGNRAVVGGICRGVGSTQRSVFCVARYLADGQLDASFGRAGKVFTLVGNNANYDSEVLSITVQPDRKIVAAGKCRSSANVISFCLARYDIDGSVDSGFGTSGIIVTEFGGGTPTAEVQAIALQGDGKIVATGYCLNAATSFLDFCVTRYLSNGLLDATFGTAGKVRTTLGTTSAYAYTLMIQQDGRVLAAGRCNGTQFCAARYETNGVLDAAFGLNGKLTIEMTAGKVLAKSLVQQVDGKLLIAGRCSNANDFATFCVVRLLLASGTLDSSFGNGGKVIRSLGSALEDSYGDTVMLQNAGRILMSGGCTNNTRNSFCSTRLLPDGQLDTSYGADSVAKLMTRAIVEMDPSGAVLQPDGKLIQSGSCKVANLGDQFCLVRYNTDGTLDMTFNGGGSGVVYTPLSGGGEAWSLAMQPDGKAILGGFCSNGSNNDFCVARYLSNGAPDDGFGNNGIVKTPMGSGADGGSAVVLQRDQKIVLAGQCAVSAGNNDFCIARYLPGGTLDTGFGSGGKVFTSMGAGNNGVNSALVQFDGKIVLAGFCINRNGNYDFCLARYLTNGTLDTSFNSTGKVFTDVSQSTDFALPMVQQADGKLLVAGTCFTGNGFDFCVARYRADGALDTTFGTTNPNVPGPGKVSYGIASGDDIGRGMAVQLDGKIVIVGDCRNVNAPTLTMFCILRLLENGALDVPFGNNGTVASPAAEARVASAVAIQPDGKILLGGSCSAEELFSACVSRYNPDGSIDRTFGTNGIGSVVNTLSAADTMYAMALLPDGKILQGGSCTNESVKEFCMARYEGGPLNYQNCSLDIDGDGVITPMLDNLIVTRAMRGMTGPAVIGGITFAPHARRTTWGDSTDRDIRRYLRSQCGMTIAE